MPIRSIEKEVKNYEIINILSVVARKGRGYRKGERL